MFRKTAINIIKHFNVIHDLRKMKTLLKTQHFQIFCVSSSQLKYSNLFEFPKSHKQLKIYLLIQFLNLRENKQKSLDFFIKV